MINQQITPEELAFIDRYLQQEMTEDEETAFRQKMNHEPGFREKVNEVRLVLLAIAETGVEEKMKTFHQHIAAPPVTGKNKTIRLRYFAVAASVAIIVSLAVWLLLMNNNAKADLYSSYYKPDPGLMTMMGRTDKYEFEKAMVSYRNGEYRQAITSWKEQLNRNPSSDTLGYFLGAAYQAAGVTDSAKIYLSKIAAQTESNFYKDANWYLALIYLKTNNRTGALSHLKLSAHSKTEELIKQLEK